MSKNVAIQEGGVAKQLTVDKLKTSLVGGGVCMWVPEDNVSLGTKSITEDGTYEASDDGYYGYSKVMVSGVGSVRGYDGDGDEAIASVDGGDNIVIKKLPSSISVVTPPTKITYNDGESISFNGLVVKAYTKSGSPWTEDGHTNGIIPISELTFPVTVADKDSVSGETTTAESDLISEPIQLASGPFKATKQVKEGIIVTEYTYFSDGTITVKWQGGLNSLAASTEPNKTLSVNWHRYWKEVFPEYQDKVPGGDIYNQTFYTNMDRSDTHNGKTAYYGTRLDLVDPVDDLPPQSPVAFDGAAAWTILYGTITTTGGTQEIPVKWASENGELSTSFGITVNESLGGATGGGGEAGDNGAGRND